MNYVLFLLAYFSVLWLFWLVNFWVLALQPKKEREVARNKLEEYKQKTGLGSAILMVIFCIFNSYALFPIRGTLTALFFISVFILYQKYVF